MEIGICSKNGGWKSLGQALRNACKDCFAIVFCGDNTEPCESKPFPISQNADDTPLKMHNAQPKFPDETCPCFAAHADRSISLKTYT